jgi:hypothetical protein
MSYEPIENRWLTAVRFYEYRLTGHKTDFVDRHRLFLRLTVVNRWFLCWIYIISIGKPRLTGDFRSVRMTWIDLRLRPRYSQLKNTYKKGSDLDKRTSDS